MNGMLNSMFLRLYGLNLGRQFRNLPTEAWTDALSQIVLLLTLPLWIVLASLISWLRADRTSVHIGSLSYIPFAAFGLPPLILWLTRRFRHYRSTPEAADSFRSPPPPLEVRTHVRGSATFADGGVGVYTAEISRSERQTFNSVANERRSGPLNIIGTVEPRRKRHDKH